MKGLRRFVLIDTVIVVIFFGLFGKWIFEGEAFKVLVALLMIVILGVIQADVIHRLSGVPLSNKKRFGFAMFSDLNHKDLGIMNKYWFADSIIFLVVSLAYILTFYRSGWRHTILLEALLIASIFLKLYENHTRIKGVSKKELFQ